MMNLGRVHWTRLASGLKRTAPSLIDVSSEEILELKPSITTLLDFFHITGVGTRYSVINISSSESLSLEESAPKDQSDFQQCLLASSEKEKIQVACEILSSNAWVPKENAKRRKILGKSTGKKENPCNLSSLADLPPSRSLLFKDLSSKVTRLPRWQPLKWRRKL